MRRLFLCSLFRSRSVSGLDCLVVFFLALACPAHFLIRLNFNMILDFTSYIRSIVLSLFIICLESPRLGLPTFQVEGEVRPTIVIPTSKQPHKTDGWISAVCLWRATRNWYLCSRHPQVYQFAFTRLARAV